MKTLILTLALLLTTNSFAMSNQERQKILETKDKKLLVIEAIKNDEVRKKVRANDNELKKQQSYSQLFKLFSDKKECDPDDDDSGTLSCWDACTKEGWSASHCKSLCGSSNEGGQESCWDKCTKEGWSASHCADSCGSSTGDGQESCWDKCTKEGWSASHCKGTCGSDTDGGQKGCWDKCTKEGWSASHCKDTCGAE